MVGEIIIRASKGKSRRQEIGKGVRLSFGRGMKADVQLFAEQVDRVHCAIENRGTDFIVTDLESEMGTFLNNTPVTGDRLAYAGDTIRIGTVELEIAGSMTHDVEDSVLVAEAVEEHADAIVLEVEPIASEPEERKKKPGKTTELIKVVDTVKTGILEPKKGRSDFSLERAHRDLATIYRVTNAINAMSETSEFGDTLAGMLLEVVSADRAAVLLRRRGGTRAEPLAVRMAEGQPLNPHVSHTVVDEVLRKGVSMLSNNIKEDERYTSGDSIITQMIKSTLCVPLLAQGEVIGALYVDSYEVGAFNEHDMELLAAIGNQAGVALERVRILNELDNLFFSTMRTLVRAVDAKDPYTHGHSERVTAFALKLASELNLPRHEREILQLAGLLHDVGKIGIPESVLNKPGDLTDEEYELMKLHPIYGAEIISSIEAPYVSEIVTVVKHHHEFWNGNGYPEGMRSEDLPLTARILSLADAFDAMTSDRPYRKGFDMGKAAEVVMSCSGTQFDPDLAEAFYRLYKQGKLVLPKTMALKYVTMATPKMD